MKLTYGEKEMAFLRSKNPVMKSLVDHYGHFDYDLEDDVFATLISNFVGQALSNKAATTIWNRLLSKAKTMTPETLLALNDEAYASIGISKAKASYIKGLSTKVISQEIALEDLSKLDEREMIETLTSIKGIGLWTAEMLALFSFGKPDVFSFGDAALRNGIRLAHHYRTLSKKRFEKMRKTYSPYGSFASLYYYRFNDDIDKTWLEEFSRAERR